VSGVPSHFFQIKTPVFLCLDSDGHVLRSGDKGALQLYLPACINAGIWGPCDAARFGVSVIFQESVTMKTSLLWRTVLAGCVFSIAFESLAAGDPAEGKKKIVVCQVCHGPDGNSPPNPAWASFTTEDIKKIATAPKTLRGNPVWAKLAGQNATYLAKQLQNYRAGTRKDAIMSEMATGLPDADIADIAAFYASQTLRPEAPNKDALSERGREIYMNGVKQLAIPACASCHGPNGRGNETLPRIAGQHAIYLQKQLWSFKLGARTTDPVMVTTASKLQEQDILALTSYISAIQ
jgi:cytochrome c553